MFIWQRETITFSTSLFILAVGKNSDFQWKWSQLSSLFQRTIDSCFAQPVVFYPLLGLSLMLLGTCNPLSIHPASHLRCWMFSSCCVHFKQDLAGLYNPFLCFLCLLWISEIGVEEITPWSPWYSLGTWASYHVTTHPYLFKMCQSSDVFPFFSA